MTVLIYLAAEGLLIKAVAKLTLLFIVFQFVQ